MRWLGCCLLVACGNVGNPAHDAKPGDAPAHTDAMPDVGTNCMTDGFDGAVLSAQWSLLAGAQPTYTLGGSKLQITDAPFATTPSNPADSWIYDLDTDKGNQIAWAHAIGGEDFTLTADVDWSSSVPELTLGAVGVSDAQGNIVAYGGVEDGSAGTTGPAYVRLHGAGAAADMGHANAPQEPGTAFITIQRIGGIATLSIDTVVVVTGPMPDLISNVVIIYVRHHNANAQYNYGTFDVGTVTICRP